MLAPRSLIGCCRVLCERLAPVVGLGILAVFLARPAAAESVCEAIEHGMRSDGSDNTAAFVKTLQECAGRTIHIARGVYVFRPTGYAVGFRIPAATTLIGDGSSGEGGEATVLQVANGGTYQGLLWLRNVSGVRIENIRFDGSSYDSGCARGLDYGHAIYVQSDKGAPSGVGDVAISGSRFHDFNGTSWVTFNADDGSPGIGLNGPVVISNNVFDSDASLAGSCAAKVGMTYSAEMVALHGSDYSADGRVANVSIQSNTFNAGYVRGAIAIWSGARDIDVLHNSILDAGMRLPMYPNTELGRYAILVYDSAHERPGLHPDGVRIVDNTIANPVSCGVYVALGRNVEIRSNRIYGQTDRFDGTLPKGAISLNRAENESSVEDNELAGNYIAISSVGSSVRLGANRISVPPGGRRDRIVQPAPH